MPNTFNAQCKRLERKIADCKKVLAEPFISTISKAHAKREQTRLEGLQSEYERFKREESV